VNKSLRSLSLRCNLITEDGAYRFAEMLETNTFLQNLDLNENQDITNGHIALPVMLQMNQCSQSPKELQLKNIRHDCRYAVSAVSKAEFSWYV